MFEISKELFDKINETKSYDEKYKLANIPIECICGYGIRMFWTYEKDGKYYYDYECYSNCD